MTKGYFGFMVAVVILCAIFTGVAIWEVRWTKKNDFVVDDTGMIPLVLVFDLVIIIAQTVAILYLGR